MTIVIRSKCNWCEGRGIVGKFYRPSCREESVLLRSGIKVPVIGEIRDSACKRCKGTGMRDEILEARN